MALCRLTDLHNNNKPIYINPLEVIAVQDVGGQTWVITTGNLANGASRHVVVAQSVEDTVKLLDGMTAR
jgi:hypothetical protein